MDGGAVSLPRCPDCLGTYRPADGHACHARTVPGALVPAPPPRLTRAVFVRTRAGGGGEGDGEQGLPTLPWARTGSAVVGSDGPQREQTPTLDAAPGVDKRSLWSWTVAP